MSSRRDFIKRAAAASVAPALTTCSRVAKLAPNPRIASVVRRDETTLRLGGVGDNFHMSWAADDQQYVAVCDGAGWLTNPKRYFNSRIFTLDGGPQTARFVDIPDFPEMPLWDVIRGASPGYYAFGTLALDLHIYQFLSTFDRRRYVGNKLIYSPDKGRTWRNHDGSTPIVFPARQKRSRENMVFFEEDQEAFSLLSVLQMGKNYEHNRDGYIYVYAPNGNTEGTMNELVMLRVPKEKLLDRRAYEFFAGFANSAAKWTPDMSERAVVHTFPRGWVNTKGAHPYAWHPSVVYNAPLDLYLMANWGMGCSIDGEWFSMPSYLGFWTAKSPWGPWTQIHEEAAWMPDNDLKARAYQPQISPKWIAKDGRSFWLVWTDFQYTEGFWTANAALNTAKSEEEHTHRFQSMLKRQPYYAFNAQRVDLNLA